MKEYLHKTYKDLNNLERALYKLGLLNVEWYVQTFDNGRVTPVFTNLRPWLTERYSHQTIEVGHSVPGTAEIATSTKTYGTFNAESITWWQGYKVEG